MKLHATAYLLGRNDPIFRMETPSNFCDLCRAVETVNVTNGWILPGEALAVEQELREARERFQTNHYEVDNRLANAVKKLKELDEVNVPVA